MPGVIGAAMYGFVVLMTASAAGDDPAPPPERPIYPVWGLAFSPDGKWLAAGAGWSGAGRNNLGWTAEGKPLVVWSTADWSIHTLREEPLVAGDITFTDDSRRMIYRTGGSEVVVVDVPSFTEQRRWVANEPRIWAVDAAPDNRTLFTGGSDKTVKSWDLTTGALLQRLEPMEDEVTALAVAPDGQNVVAGTNRGMMRVWNAETGEVRRSYQPNSFYVSTAGFSRDGRFVFVVTYEGALRIYDRESFLLRAKLKYGTNSGDISPGLEWAASSGSFDGTLSIHRLNLKTADAELNRHIAGLIEQFEHDDVAVREAAAADIREIGMPAVPALAAALKSPHAETRVRSRRLLQEVRSPEPVLRLSGHVSTVDGLCFSPDGTLLATGCRGGIVKVWRVGPFTEVATLEIPRPE